MKNKNQRKTVEIGSKRIPMRKLFHGKEIREAAKALEDSRLIFKEEEILYGAKLHLKWIDYDQVHLVATRLETDTEFEERLEKQRIAEELKKEREIKRKRQAEIRKAEEAIRQKARIAEYIRKTAKDNGLTAKDLQDIFKDEQGVE